MTKFRNMKVFKQIQNLPKGKSQTSSLLKHKSKRQAKGISRKKVTSQLPKSQKVFGKSATIFKPRGKIRTAKKVIRQKGKSQLTKSPKAPRRQLTGRERVRAQLIAKAKAKQLQSNFQKAQKKGVRLKPTKRKVLQKKERKEAPYEVRTK